MKRFLMLLLLVLPCVGGAQEQGLGRLFTTPTERSNLDYLRQSKKVLVKEEMQVSLEESVPEVEKVKMPDSPVTVQGFVKRSDGKSNTMWVNGKPVQERTATQELRVGSFHKQDNRVNVQLNGSGKVLRLKPGQMYQPETGRVIESTASVMGEEVGIVDNE